MIVFTLGYLFEGMELCLKKNALHTTLFILTFPMSVQALGLGKMKVESALDQPFLAEIELIDAQSALMTSVKASLASPQNFKSLGIIPSDVFALLQFAIKKNKQGHFVVTIRSTERMSEPYMQLVVDLTWPQGQLYKAYTILLDPPGYKLTATRAQNGPTYYKKLTSDHPEKTVNPAASAESKEQITYGPTSTNENVWQIAQRYKTSQLILPQIVLAIVGQNPEAFNQGNLNGLKADAQLNIPSVAEMMNVPADLATVEVMAHDKAWNEKTPINHVLSPPYMNGQATPEIPVVEYSKIPPVPQFAQNMVDSTLDLLASQLPSIQTQNPISVEQDVLLKTERSVASAAVDSLRESNAMLLEQLHLMQTENKKLQGQLDKRDKQLNLLRHQLRIIQKERQEVAAQTSTATSTGDSTNLWLFIFLLITAGGGIAFWYFKHQTPKENEPLEVEEVKPVKAKPELPVQPELTPEPELPTESKLQELVPIQPIETVPDVDEPVIEKTDELPENNLLEFESGLHQLISDKETPKEPGAEETVEKEQGESMEFTPSPSVEPEHEELTDENKPALDTLLDLAKTYIGMGDKESALHSLNEVLEQGTEAQKEEAQRIIDDIK